MYPSHNNQIPHPGGGVLNTFDKNKVALNNFRLNYSVLPQASGYSVANSSRKPGYVTAALSALSISTGLFAPRAAAAKAITIR